VPPWFSPNWRALYAAALKQIQELERLAKLAGRQTRPKEERK
jgi:hypothetical protein